MQLLNPLSDGRSNVRILGISAQRVEVLSPIAVMPGTLIQLRLRDRDVFLLAEARSCRAVGHTYRVGMDIQDQYASHTRTPGAHLGYFTEV